MVIVAAVLEVVLMHPLVPVSHRPCLPLKQAHTHTPYLAPCTTSCRLSRLVRGHADALTATHALPHAGCTGSCRVSGPCMHGLPHAGSESLHQVKAHPCVPYPVHAGSAGSESLRQVQATWSELLDSAGTPARQVLQELREYERSVAAELAEISRRHDERAIRMEADRMWGRRWGGVGKVGRGWEVVEVRARGLRVWAGAGA